MIRLSAPTRIGLTNPNSTMDAAICAIWVSLWVRALLAKGNNLSSSQRSMRWTNVGEVILFESSSFLFLKHKAPTNEPNGAVLFITWLRFQITGSVLYRGSFW